MTGRIGQAVDLLNAHYPNVLAPPPPPAVPASTTAAAAPSVSSKSAFARPLAATKSSTPSPCTPQTFFVAPSPNPAPPPHPPHRASPIPHLRPSSSSLSPSASAVTGAQFGSWASSLAPEIISLNLQTQTFIELMRTAHASSAISTPSTPTSSVHGGLTGGGGGGGGGGGDAHSSDAEMSASTSSLGGSASILNVAIAQSQALREKVLQLEVGQDREGWERECIDVCGLLAYKDLATCPVRGYLSQSRRDILAEMVNSAILREFSAHACTGSDSRNLTYAGVRLPAALPFSPGHRTYGPDATFAPLARGTTGDRHVGHAPRDVAPVPSARSNHHGTGPGQQ